MAPGEDAETNSLMLMGAVSASHRYQFSKGTASSWKMPAASHELLFSSNATSPLRMSSKTTPRPQVSRIPLASGALLSPSAKRASSGLPYKGVKLSVVRREPRFTQLSRSINFHL